MVESRAGLIDQRELGQRARRAEQRGFGESGLLDAAAAPSRRTREQHAAGNGYNGDGSGDADGSDAGHRGQVMNGRGRELLHAHGVNH